MFSAFRSARRKSIRSTAASFALAIALTGGVAVGSTALTPGIAQAQNSEGFVEAYRPVAAMVQADVANFEGARAAIPGVIAAIETENDRHIAGNLILNIGNNLDDPALQRQGLEMMVASGLVEPERVPQFNWFIGSLAFNAEDYAASRAALMAALNAGYSDPEADLVALIAETYDREDNPTQAIAFLTQQIEAAQAAGNPIPERWLLSALQTSYDNDLREQAVDIGELVVANYPSERNWSNTLQIVSQLHEFSESERIDLYRLMLVAGVLTERPDVSRFIDDLDPRVRANEVERVLAHALANGIYTETDGYYVDVNTVASARARADRNGLAAIVSEGQSGDGLDAINAGDVLYSLEDYARAATAYQAALDKGFDRNTALTRLGIAQAMGGDHAAALETLARVDGSRAPIARMWSAYINSTHN